MRITLRGIAGIALLSSLLALAAPVAAAEVNLNTATQEELVALPGIGPAKAKAIIDYRTAHPFKSVDEVKNVRGIGDHLYESLKDKVTVSSAGSAEGR
jgi:competence protein ComEA